MKKYKFTKNIENKADVKKSIWKNKQLLWFMAFFIIVLMVGSVLTLWIRDEGDSKEIDYNGHKFVYNQQTGWTTIVNGQQVSFEMLPTDIEGVKKESFFGLDVGKTYVAFNPAEFSEKSYEINRLISFLAFTGRQAFPACTKEEGCGDLPVINCTSTTSNVVYLVVSNETRIKQDYNCLILEAKPGDEIKVITMFLYQLLGIEK